MTKEFKELKYKNRELVEKVVHLQDTNEELVKKLELLDKKKETFPHCS